MTLIENQFFALLRAGLWNKEPDISLFEGDIAWGELLDMAKKQTVLGVLGDGIGKLPEEYRPSPADLHRVKSQLHLIRRSHLLLNATLKEVCARLREADIHPILLKGQGVALCYRYPEQRQCGDIDLYICPGDYEKACSVVRDFGQKTGEESESIQHYHFTRNGVTIEIHRLAAYSVVPSVNRKLQHLISRYLQEKDSGCRYWEEAGVLLPPVNFDAFYLFYHFAKHFMQTGTGLRQVCDWVRYLHVHQSELDKERLLADVRLLGLMPLWEIFGCIAVDYLGLPEHEFPGFNPDKRKKARRVVSLIFKVGNFGQYAPIKGERPKSYYRGKLYAFGKWLWWKQQIFTLSPLIFSRWSLYSFGYSLRVALLRL